MERDSLEPTVQAEKRLMPAQLSGILEQLRAEIPHLKELHQEQMGQRQQEEEQRRAPVHARSPSQEAPGSEKAPVDPASAQRGAQLEGWCSTVSLFQWNCRSSALL